MQQMNSIVMQDGSVRLKQVEIFQALDDAAIGRLVDAMAMAKFQHGDKIVEQGAAPDALYVIVAGACVVKKKTLVNRADGQVVGRLQQFDHFGEAALMYPDARQQASFSRPPARGASAFSKELMVQ